MTFVLSPILARRTLLYKVTQRAWVGILQGHVTAHGVVGRPGKAHFAANGDEPEHLVEILGIIGEDKELCIRELRHLAPLYGSEFDNVLHPKRVSCGTVIQTLAQGPFKSGGSRGGKMAGRCLLQVFGAGQNEDAVPVVLKEVMPEDF